MSACLVGALLRGNLLLLGVYLGLSVCVYVC